VPPGSARSSSRPRRASRSTRGEHRREPRSRRNPGIPGTTRASSAALAKARPSAAPPRRRIGVFSSKPGDSL
jgi:hypothetical protein